eukprot:CAMPEP_0115077110 /NCGR_PEP_ID=MMETSP0227-20121206/16803_1 /TAXON_ID=89957 /ORGANISM="Polarella glacialis, Strain CCMP 1383" /LENGTH=900 /DNA_ID=CAMNT_0002464331 /DNA_START=69 /DNA_END=2771 /DNA_ORIENTATION=+
MSAAVADEELASDSLSEQLVGISEPVVRALVKVGITGLTPVQVACLPHCLKGEDILAKAKTGTGKTLAFLIPTVERLLRNLSPPEEGVDAVRSLVLSSTRELAAQIVSQAEALTQFLPGFNIELVLGGHSIVPQRQRLDPTSSGEFPYSGVVDLMIATPGRLLEHIEGTNGLPDRLLGLETLILDEVDQLLDGGFQRAIESIIAQLPKKRHTLCFSATVPDKLLKVLGMALQEGHVVVDCVGKNQEVDTHASVEQFYMVHPLEQSMFALYACVRKEMERNPDSYKILAFLPTARQTEFSTAVLKQMGLDVMEMHARVKQNQREKVAETFRAGTKMVLLSSDVSARGVDYPDISLVLQVGAPTTPEVYVQRLGRTGRAGKSGRGILLLGDYEKVFLQKLKGLPITDLPGHDPSEDLCKVQAAAGLVDDDIATQTYRAWISAMIGTRKSYKWSREDLIANANLFALKVLGRETIPALAKDFVATVGLQGLEGLNVVDSLPSADSSASLTALGSCASLSALGSCASLTALGSCASLSALDEEAAAEARAEVNHKLMRPVLKNFAQTVSDAILAMNQEDLLGLEAKLKADGEAEVAGQKVLAAWVTFQRTAAPGGRGRKKDLAKLEKKVEALAAVGALKIAFPIGGNVEGVKSILRPVIEFKNLSFRYGKDKDFLVSDMSGSLTLGSRVAICGSTGCGKSTLMSILCSELKPTEGKDGAFGKFDYQGKLRVGHAKQESEQLLGPYLDSSPLDYISKRFGNGYDEELRQQFVQAGDEEQAQSLCDAVKAAGAAPPRPVTRREVKKHCEAFGMDEEMCCVSKIRSLSESQKLCLCLAAVCWTKPHFIAVDDFTKHLDSETTAALLEAFKNFKGGILMIDPNSEFVEKVCTETWTMDQGVVTVANIR